MDKNATATYLRKLKYHDTRIIKEANIRYFRQTFVPKLKYRKQFVVENLVEHAQSAFTKDCEKHITAVAERDKKDLKKKELEEKKKKEREEKKAKRNNGNPSKPRKPRKQGNPRSGQSSSKIKP